MKLSGLSTALIILLVLLVLQSIGGYMQIQDYRKAVRRMHKLGNVGIGQKRGRFLNGHVAIIACDSEGIINGAEVMDGIGVWARFHPVDTFLDKKQFRKYRGYVRALEALEARLLDKDLTREQEKYMAERNKGKRKGI